MNVRLRNVLLLTLTQATSSTSVTLVAAVGSLAGYALASNKALATLPSTMAVIGTALSTIPASMLMKRVGRRVGFIVGALCAMIGGLISVAAMAHGQFWLLAAAALFLGVSVAFAQQYRFAAAETSLPEFRSRAISFVLAGGLAAAFIGPMLARGTVQLFETTYLGAYLCVPVLGVLTAAWLAGLRMPPLSDERHLHQRRGASDRGNRAPADLHRGRPRPDDGAGGDEPSDDRDAAGHDGPPPHVRGHGVRHPVARGGDVPARLLHRHARPALGERTVILLGIALNVLAVAAAWLDVGVYNFFLAMTLNGIGWNFMFVAGSALVTKAYAPAERARTQAANDFLVFGTAAVTSLSSGQLLHHRGWQVVLTTAAVMLLAALAGSLWRVSRAAGPTERSGLAAAD